MPEEECRHDRKCSMLPKALDLSAVVVCDDCSEVGNLPLTWFCTSPYTNVRRKP